MDERLTTQMGVVSIRPAGTANAPQLRELRLEALAAHPEAFAADYRISSAESAGFWSRRVADYEAQKSGVMYLAAAGERLIGMTGLVRGHWPKTRHSGTIWGVYVNREWRGLGVAEALIHGCLAWAGEQGLAVVKLAVITSNTAAIRCYARCGFAVYGLEPQVIYHDGTYYDELLMARAVGASERPPGPG